MLNLGLIGDIQLLEPFTKRAQEHPQIHIAGKSSVGTQPLHSNSRISVPEFNRIELIERSDVLLINRFSLLPFQLLCDIVKKSKHFFAACYPELTDEECRQIEKLRNEAQTVIQVNNPFYYLPSIQWLNQNLRKPAFVEIAYFNEETPSTDLLIHLLLMLNSVTRNVPKKTGAISFRSEPQNSTFSTCQLEFGDGTITKINFGNMGQKSEFKVKTFARNQFVSIDVLGEKAVCNNSPVDLTSFKKKNETEAFIESVIQKQKSETGIEEYRSVVQTAKTIVSKLEQFTSL
jgi:hypothetical protein